MKEQITQGDEAVLKEHGLVGMPRPRAARYLDIHPGKESIELRSGPLGPPHATPDKLMARYYEETMRRITKPSSVLRRLAGGSARGPWMGRRVAKLYSRGVMGPHAGG